MNMYTATLADCIPARLAVMAVLAAILLVPVGLPWIAVLGVAIGGLIGVMVATMILVVMGELRAAGRIIASGRRRDLTIGPHLMAVAICAAGTVIMMSIVMQMGRAG